MSQPANNTPPTFSAFWPFCLLALSMAIFLGWQVQAAARQYRESLRMIDQQTLVASQASQAEERLRAVMLDLITLAQTDPDARGIVTKYGISYNPPAAAAGQPVSAPAAAPALAPEAPAAAAP